MKKIAVLRANALGDFIFILPALRALKQTFPDSQITLLGKHWHKNFLANRPSDIDRVVVVPRSKGVNGNEKTEGDINALSAFFKDMHEERFDMALQLHGGGKYSNPFIIKLGAKQTIGLKTNDAVPLDKWIPYIYYQHEILRYLEVVSLIGAKTNNLQPHISVTKNDINEVSEYIQKKENIIVIHPGASDPRRRWNPQRFAEVGDLLSKQGYTIAITGTENEADIAEEVVSHMKEKAENLSGKLSLSGLTGLLSFSKLVISNDTGPLHVADAVDAKTVGLYWCINMINASILQREKHRPCISWRPHCPTCNEKLIKTQLDFQENTCQHNDSLLDEISVEEVINTALELLK